MRYTPLIALISLAIMNYNAKGYFFAIFAFLYMLVYKKTFIRIDKKFVYLFFFGLAYMMFYYYNYGTIDISNLVYFYAFSPPFILQEKDWQIIHSKTLTK